MVRDAADQLRLNEEPPGGTVGTFLIKIKMGSLIEGTQMTEDSPGIRKIKSSRLSRKENIGRPGLSAVI